MSIAGQVLQPVWIGGLPGAAAQPPALRLELATVADAGPVVAAQPFVGVCETGRFARVLLGRLAGAGGFERPVAIKIQRDVCRLPTGGGAVLFDNGQIDAMWRRERDQLRALSGRVAPRWLPVPADDQLLPPTAFDRGTGRLFEVPSPSFLPLRVCRDDERLRAAGLEPWSGSPARYLWCAKDPDHSVFYTWSTGDGAQARPGIKVVRRHQLFADLLSAWRALPADRRAAAAERFPAATAVLADLDGSFGGASIDLEALAQRLVPLNFYDAHAFATELQDLHFDEYCDLIGGATLGEVMAATPGAGPARASVQARLQPLLAGANQWAAAMWSTADEVRALPTAAPERLRRLALEVTWLKLQAFSQVCQLVRDFHAATGGPHLGLAPDNVMFTHPGNGRAAAPVRHGFEACCIDVGTLRQPLPAGLGVLSASVQLPAPAPDVARTFLSPLVEAARSQVELVLHVTARPAGAERPSVLVLELRAARDRPEGVQAGDLVRLLPEGRLPGLGDQPLVALVGSVTRDTVTAEVDLPVAMPSALPVFVATATFHRRLDLGCDLFGLGMLLARALLGHDRRDLFAVRELWDGILDRLAASAAGRKPDPVRLLASLRGLVEAEREQLAGESVLWPAALREAVSNPVPAPIWRDLLLLVGRLLTAGTPLAVAPAVAGSDVLAPVLATIDDLLARLQVELTETEARAADLAAIAQQLATAATSAMVGGGGGGAR